MAQPRRKLKNLWLNLLLIVGGLLAALFLLELGARFLPPPFKDTPNQAETCWEAAGWRGRPNFQTTVATEGYVHDLTLNSRGMHDTEHPLEKSDGIFRILFLGDSFVHAVHVDEKETAHQVLQDALNNRHPPQIIEVISAGVSGWGTAQQLLYYRAEGRRYRPDLVLLLFYLGNDVKDNLPGRGITVDGVNCYAPYFVLNNGQLDPNPWQFAPGLTPATGSTSFWRKSFNNLLAGLYRHSRLYAQIEPLLAPPEVKASMLDFYIGNNDTFDYGFKLTTALVGQLRREVEADGAHFGVVLVSPLSLAEFMQMDAGAREEVYQRFPVLRRAEEIDPPNVTLFRQFSANKIPTLDLLPPFLNSASTTDTVLYFKQDHHWTVAGNRLAGQVIAHWLIDEQLAP